MEDDFGTILYRPQEPEHDASDPNSTSQSVNEGSRASTEVSGGGKRSESQRQSHRQAVKKVESQAGPEECIYLEVSQYHVADRCNVA